ncbi:hypothetical protein Q31b_30000 [Novipirellula aureliae]|uniref:Uncharacterized protein n=1 Tax=Novipirellula aureliae TaxID=2527966 RepID=A0A5C6E1L2_9BACT|nr:hypothetical protein Q31b_30000 [Novipirellula aureliae]
MVAFTASIKAGSLRHICKGPFSRFDVVLVIMCIKPMATTERG